MKKFLLITFVSCFLLAGTSAHAQLLRFGVKAGATFNKFSLSDVPSNSNSDSYTGWQLGLMARVKVPLIGLSVQPEALYSMVGSGDSKFGYLQVPINVQWGVDLMVARIYAQVGPYFGYALKLPKVANDVEKSDIFNKDDWGIGVGLGADLFKHVNIAFKYDFGMKNVSKVDEFDIKNRTFNLSVGYFF